MAVIFIKENLKNSDCRCTNLIISENGYYKISREFYLGMYSPKEQNYFTKNGNYISGNDSQSGSSIYLQRHIASFYYDITGLEVHHLDKDPFRNDIWNLVPLPETPHRRIDGYTDFKKGFDEAIELKKELQIKQFSEKEELVKNSKNTLQTRENIILDILRLKAEGLSANGIIKKMRGKVGEKKIRKYLKTFFYAKEFLDYLEIQSDYEFLDLYANLDEKWQFIAKWEKYKDKTLQEFQASKHNSSCVSSLIMHERSINAKNYYGNEVHELMEVIFNEE